jgi:hypothetical protein
MHTTMRTILTAVAAIAGAAAIVHAGSAPSGVQWTPDTDFILVNKDVGNERWAITLNVANLTATGNVFFTDDRSPSFIFCQNTGEDFDAGAGELDLFYTCSGAERGLGGFGSDDWSLVSDDILLPLSFFIPEAETCDLGGALNGSNENNASSVWACGGSDGTFDFYLFADGTALSSATGELDFDALTDGCQFVDVGDAGFLDVEYSPSRDLLTIFEVPSGGGSVIVSECGREFL